MVVTNFFTETDFITILTDFGRQLVLSRVSRAISNYSGQETLTEGTGEALEAYFMRYSQGWDYEKFGFLVKGDVVMLSKYADAVEKDDVIYADPSGTLSINVIDGDTTQIQVICNSAHGQSIGDPVQITGTTNYDGSYTVSNIINSNEFRVAANANFPPELNTGTVLIDFTKYRVKEAFNVPGVFDNTGFGTRYIYTACNLFIDDSTD